MDLIVFLQAADQSESAEALQKKNDAIAFLQFQLSVAESQRAEAFVFGRSQTIELDRLRQDNSVLQNENNSLSVKLLQERSEGQRQAEVYRSESLFYQNELLRYKNGSLQLLCY